MAVQEIEQQVEELKSDMAKLRGDLSGILQTLLEAGKSEAGEVKEQMEAKAMEQLETLKGAVQATRDRGQRAVEQLGHRVEQNPMLSVLGALGVGFMLGVVLDRSGRR